MSLRKGSRFRVIEEVRKKALVYFAAPFTGGFECILPVGALLMAARDIAAGDSEVFLVPEDKELYETKYLPEQQRADPKYMGFAFLFKISDIGKIIVPIP
jgi:hypothetical protein